MYCRHVNGVIDGANLQFQSAIQGSSFSVPFS